MSFASAAAIDLERKNLVNLQIQNCYKSIPILHPPQKAAWKNIYKVKEHLPKRGILRETVSFIETASPTERP
jgi:hypothetical protein